MIYDDVGDDDDDDDQIDMHAAWYYRDTSLWKHDLLVPPSKRCH